MEADGAMVKLGSSGAISSRHRLGITVNKFQEKDIMCTL